MELPQDPRLLVGLEGRDDAGVYLLNDEQAIIQTLDFFTPMVDDPYVFGQIAAVNALNDVYAMGGQPLLAMNIVMFPECEDFALLRQILEGGLSKVKEAGALLVGGHSVDDNEPKYGLSVTGMVHPDKLLTNAGAQKGDRLYLTKPIGNGIIATAIKGELAAPESEQEAIYWMTSLNRRACEAAQQVELHAATDVTGFGLIGHLYEMAAASQVQVELFAGQVPLMNGVMDAANMGLIPAGAYANRDYLLSMVRAGSIDSTLFDLLFSPETAGGLLLAVPEKQVDSLQQAMKKAACPCYEIGRVVGEGQDRPPIQII